MIWTTDLSGIQTIAEWSRDKANRFKNEIPKANSLLQLVIFEICMRMQIVVNYSHLKYANYSWYNLSN